MSYIIADNIISPLGFSTEENVLNVLRGKSCLKRYEDHWYLPEPFMASLFSESQQVLLKREGLTFFESVAVHSIEQAIGNLKGLTATDVKSAHSIFILSTTKANVSQLEEEKPYVLPAESAQRIADSVGLKGESIVVCNACISGLSAIILADRLLRNDYYEYAVVCGIDVQSDFIVSGFQSFKALSIDECRPFDIERLGLNLGEAAATVILSTNVGEDKHWTITDEAMSNDAYHISAPSKTGVGLQMVLKELMKNHATDEMALINAHGTATMFNDQMEGIALRESGLTSIPVTGLKGYFGHTMGAAGVLETIICMHSLDKNAIPGTRGYAELGVSGRLYISADARHTEKTSFIKLLSGFGGCNAGIVCSHSNESIKKQKKEQCIVSHEVRITGNSVEIDGSSLVVEGTGQDMLIWLYKTYVTDYPKYYKMDKTCRLGFLASELLLMADDDTRFQEKDDRGVILFNRNTTTDTDRKFYASIDRGEYFPSPSVFVYTLPNILAGEIAIRNMYHGETCHYLLPSFDKQMMQKVVDATFANSRLHSAITGWVDVTDDNTFTAHLQLTECINK